MSVLEALRETERIFEKQGSDPPEEIVLTKKAGQQLCEEYAALRWDGVKPMHPCGTAFGMRVRW